MKASDLMTSDPCCCSPNDSLQEVARAMREIDCGAVPVIDEGRLVGIVTDRDLAVRALAEGKDASARVGDVMTPDPFSCSADDDISAVKRIMTDNAVRRVPVVDSDGQCIGIVSQADLARAAADGGSLSDREGAIVVEQISVPRSGFSEQRSSTIEERL